MSGCFILPLNLFEDTLKVDSTVSLIGTGSNNASVVEKGSRRFL